MSSELTSNPSGTNQSPPSPVVAESAVSAGTAKTPYDLYFDEMKKFRKQHGFVGALLVVGLDDDGDDEAFDDEEEHDNERSNAMYTKEQMNDIRVIMISKERDNDIDMMRDLVLGDQAHSNIMMFDTSYSYHVLGTFEIVRKKLARMKNPSKKLNLLIAYTHTLTLHDVWMYDNEGGMDVITNGLGKLWKALLKKSDEELGWDVEYTKPGVLALLRQFQETLESLDECYHCYGYMQFEYMWKKDACIEVEEHNDLLQLRSKKKDK